MNVVMRTMHVSTSIIVLASLLFRVEGLGTFYPKHKIQIDGNGYTGIRVAIHDEVKANRSQIIQNIKVTDAYL